MHSVIAVAAHKAYPMPGEEIYLPLFVGAAGKASPDPAWARDDTGDNISAKNPGFCELTGHYWLWKNVDAQVYGLCHYRRYFAGGWRPRERRMLRPGELERLMARHAIVLPPKRHYWIETNASQYAHAHHAKDLAAAREALSALHPEALPAWDAVMARRSGHRFNMFLMRKEPFEAYSAWLFPLLFALEERLDLRGYSAYDRRVFGFLGERLLDVWLEATGLPYGQCPVVNLERQRWGRKIFRFLQRKWRGGRR